MSILVDTNSRSSSHGMQSSVSPPFTLQSHSQAQYPNNLSSYPNVKPRNDVELSREMLMTYLAALSVLTAQEFNGVPVRLVVHGGACMLLHPDLHRLATQRAALNDGNINGIPLRRTTRDVDFIQRSFITDYAKLGFPDAAQRLKRCIRAVAMQYGLGADWMNSDPDIALPMAVEPNTGQQYDPIYAASMQPNNILVHTIFTSPNGLLTLIGVAPFWSIALKLVRYSPRDAGDISLILQNGTSTRGVRWTTDLVESWLYKSCWPMGYINYPPEKLAETKRKIKHAVGLLGPDATAEPPVIPVIARLTSPPPPPSQLPHQGWAGPGVWTSSPPGPAQPPALVWGAVIPPVQDFDRSVGEFLTTQTYHHDPDHALEYFDSKSRGSKKEKSKKKEKKNKKKQSKTRARRAKWMLGWTEPDDSDGDQEFYSDDDDDERARSSGSESWTMIPSNKPSPPNPKSYPPHALDLSPLSFGRPLEGYVP